MRILGISAFYHDSAAALIEDGHVVAAAQEERFTRKKHDAQFPVKAVEYCTHNLGPSAPLDAVVFYDKPVRKFERLLHMHLAMAPDGMESFAASIPLWLGNKLFQGRAIRASVESISGWTERTELLFAEHHQSHAASAFFASPFSRAVVLTMDGVGEWTTTSIGLGLDNRLVPVQQIRFPHSLGLLYSAFTAYLGFKPNSGEYKVMGLAPYGTPIYKELILRELVDLKPDGSFRLDMRYFGYCTGLSMTTEAFHELFGGPPRRAETELTQHEMDIAASIQAVTEEIILMIARHLRREYGEDNLCLAGGVALNCVANGKILSEKLFKRIWIQPAAGDAGGALGAALSAYYMHYQRPRPAPVTDAMCGGFLGPACSSDDASRRLRAAGARLRELNDPDLLAEVADALSRGLAVGWVQGRMEYGPRALGARSILADPRRPEMQRELNLKIKFRESFRPFAPAVLDDQVGQWFDLDVESPYMLLVAPVGEQRRRAGASGDVDAGVIGLAKLGIVRSEVPAITHVDYSARVQTVHRETNPRFHALLSEFHARTGCPILINTSFNVRGEPIVCTPEDAFRCFMGTSLDLLAVENCVMYKTEQDPSLQADYTDRFSLD